MNPFKGIENHRRWLLWCSVLLPMVLIIKDVFIPITFLFFFVSIIPFVKPNKNNISIAVICLLCFFGMNCISILYSFDLDTGIFKLTTKLSFIIFPVLIYLLNSDGRKIILSGFISGLINGALVSMILSFIRAIYRYGSIGKDAFREDMYSWNLHASYLSLILIIAVLFLWRDLKKGSLKSLVYALVFTGLALGNLLIVRSLGAMVCVGVILLVLPFWKGVSLRSWKWLSLIPIFVLVFISLVKFSPKFNNDFTTTYYRITDWIKSPEEFLLTNKNNMESNTVRLVSWTLASRLIAKFPYGVGIGDEFSALEIEYRFYGYTYYVYKKLNPHNQFIQTGVGTGWIGVYFLITFFFLMLFKLFIRGDMFLFLIVLSIALSCCFESMLERQVGVILLSIIFVIVEFSEIRFVRSNILKE